MAESSLLADTTHDSEMLRSVDSYALANKAFS